MEWEYLVRVFTTYELEAELNKLGHEGWELVSVSADVKGAITVRQPMKAVLKRPVKQLLPA